VALNNTRLMELTTAFLYLKNTLFAMRFSHGRFKRGVTNNRKGNNARAVLGVFAKVRKAVMSFLVYVRPSISPHETTRLILKGFEDLSKNSRLIKIRVRKIRYFIWKLMQVYETSLSCSCNEKCSRKSCRKNQSVHFMVNKVSPKIVPSIR